VKLQVLADLISIFTTGFSGDGELFASQDQSLWREHLYWSQSRIRFNLCEILELTQAVDSLNYGSGTERRGYLGNFIFITRIDKAQLDNICFNCAAL
jgi:hypothetical protein